PVIGIEAPVVTLFCLRRKRQSETRSSPLVPFNSFVKITLYRFIMERKQLIAEVVRYDPRLADLPRANLFLLWFSDIESFRSLQAKKMKFPMLLHMTTRVPNLTIPGIANKECLQRDNTTCVLTGGDQPGLECANVAPYKLKDRVSKRKAKLLSGPNHQDLINTEQVKNLVPLGTQESCYQESCLCAFLM
ncbi:hypothetical protein N7471_001009, partial [Penicillium samsonianum]|uniref:uncharacterized protein n=1 Tax=Penicillium samsonianum TaxID=1882272 RepID=UPI00254835D7